MGDTKNPGETSLSQLLTCNRAVESEHSPIRDGKSGAVINSLFRRLVAGKGSAAAATTAKGPPFTLRGWTISYHQKGRTLGHSILEAVSKSSPNEDIAKP